MIVKESRLKIDDQEEIDDDVRWLFSDFVCDDETLSLSLLKMMM